MPGIWKHIDTFLRGLVSPGATLSEQDPSDAAARFQALVRLKKTPALAVRVQREGTVLVRAAFGQADLEHGLDAQPETRFRIASISKPITASALAEMVTAGTLQLDDRVTTYVPEFPEHGIRIRHLASHTAGIRSYRGKEYALNRPMDFREGLELFRKDPLLFAPGTGYRYNSFDFVLLSLAMERAADCPFEDLVQNTVLEPLGMTHTLPEDPELRLAEQAVPYTRTRQGFRKAIPVDNRYKLAGGGYLSTVDDICRLGQAWLEGKVASSAVRHAFWTAAHIDGESTYYGLGWEVSADPRGQAYYGHTGNSVGAYSIFRVYPDTGVVATVLMNVSDPKTQPELEGALKAAIASNSSG